MLTPSRPLWGCNSSLIFQTVPWAALTAVAAKRCFLSPLSSWPGGGWEHELKSTGPWTLAKGVPGIQVRGSLRAQCLAVLSLGWGSNPTQRLLVLELASFTWRKLVLLASLSPRIVRNLVTLGWGAGCQFVADPSASFRSSLFPLALKAFVSRELSGSKLWYFCLEQPLPSVQVSGKASGV